MKRTKTKQKWNVVWEKETRLPRIYHKRYHSSVFNSWIAKPRKDNIQILLQRRTKYLGKQPALIWQLWAAYRMKVDPWAPIQPSREDRCRKPLTTVPWETRDEICPAPSFLCFWYKKPWVCPFLEDYNYKIIAIILYTSTHGHMCAHMHIYMHSICILITVLKIYNIQGIWNRQTIMNKVNLYKCVYLYICKCLCLYISRRKL